MDLFFCLGITDPRSIDSSLLHPWLRICFKSYNIEKHLEQDRVNGDIYAVSVVDLYLTYITLLSYLIL